jgi:hypothetical protein
VCVCVCVQCLSIKQASIHKSIHQYHKLSNSQARRPLHHHAQQGPQRVPLTTSTQQPYHDWTPAPKQHLHEPYVHRAVHSIVPGWTSLIQIHTRIQKPGNRMRPVRIRPGQNFGFIRMVVKLGANLPRIVLVSRHLPTAVGASAAKRRNVRLQRLQRLRLSVPNMYVYWS